MREEVAWETRVVSYSSNYALNKHIIMDSSTQQCEMVKDLQWLRYAMRIAQLIVISCHIKGIRPGFKDSLWVTIQAKMAPSMRVLIVLMCLEQVFGIGVVVVPNESCTWRGGDYGDISQCLNDEVCIDNMCRKPNYLKISILSGSHWLLWLRKRPRLWELWQQQLWLWYDQLLPIER